jgi:CO/xanthine dehydrogenase Mo-binding subunit
VEVRLGECDIGQGACTTFAQIAAETLGVDVAAISVAPVDTDTSPFAIGTFGSRVTTIGGEAVRMAAADARRKVLAAVAAEWNVPSAELEIAGGAVRCRSDLRRQATLASAIALAAEGSGADEVVGEGEYRVEGVTIPDRITKYGNISSAYSFATHAARVEVDAGTGRVRVLDYVAAHDVGRAINPMGVEGQIEGGVAQGIGYALLEEIKVRDGRVVNGDFLDYRIPTALDLPPVKSVLVETISPTGPYGAKSIGELALVPSAAAIANAIADATGVRFTELPITPDKILAAIGPKEA